MIALTHYTVFGLEDEVEDRFGAWVKTEEAEAAVAERDILLSELVDPGFCWYDHNGCCQEHSLAEKPCPHERAKKLLGSEDE